MKAKDKRVRMCHEKKAEQNAILRKVCFEWNVLKGFNFIDVNERWVLSK